MTELAQRQPAKFVVELVFLSLDEHLSEFALKVDYLKQNLAHHQNSFLMIMAYFTCLWNTAIVLSSLQDPD